MYMHAVYPHTRSHAHLASLGMSAWGTWGGWSDRFAITTPYGTVPGGLTLHRRPWMISQIHGATAHLDTLPQRPLLTEHEVLAAITCLQVLQPQHSRAVYSIVEYLDLYADLCVGKLLKRYVHRFVNDRVTHITSSALSKSTPSVRQTIRKIFADPRQYFHECDGVKTRRLTRQHIALVTHDDPLNTIAFDAWIELAHGSLETAHKEAWMTALLEKLPPKSTLSTLADAIRLVDPGIVLAIQETLILDARLLARILCEDRESSFRT
jgi:hypothetical protein